MARGCFVFGPIGSYENVDLCYAWIDRADFFGLGMSGGMGLEHCPVGTWVESKDMCESSLQVAWFRKHCEYETIRNLF